MTVGDDGHRNGKWMLAQVYHYHHVVYRNLVISNV
jgi:hypothetical protein